VSLLLAASVYSTPGLEPALERRSYLFKAAGTPKFAQRGFLQKLTWMTRTEPSGNSKSTPAGALDDRSEVLGATGTSAELEVELEAFDMKKPSQATACEGELSVLWARPATG
jgi:hypothetical protein